MGDIPKNLSHCPLKYVKYCDHDGIYAGDTDAQFLSLGISTWDNQELSLKVWRKKDENSSWSRQSEELPLHRAIDLTMLLVTEMLHEDKIEFTCKDSNKELIEIQKNKEVDRLKKIKNLDDYFNSNKDNEVMIKYRLRALKLKIDKLLSE